MTDEQTPVMQAPSHITITVEEYERLKKLDENVKKEIKGFESMKGGFTRFHDIYRVAEDRIKLLESLYE